MGNFSKYETVIGLEVHIQLQTKSKAYTTDGYEYGAAPNTLVGPVTLGLPGTLPVFNTKVAEYAIKLGAATQSNITHKNRFARKNYFYADLPKGYQISQDKTPICTGGKIRILDAEGQITYIELERIHMEEDTGKSLHEQDPYESLIDLNRAGVPLLEMVTKPEIKNGIEAYNYLTAVRKLVRYLDICDGNMEEGSLRCDANISVRRIGEKQLGQKVEVKNMNSMRNVQKAIDFERKRQIQAIENGESIVQETRNFDATTNSTISMRSKEMAHDYRYFPEPDLPPVLVTEKWVENIKKQMPPLPDQLFDKYTSTFKLSEQDASLITETREEALYFEQILEHTANVKQAANWLNVQIKAYLNEQGIHINTFPVSAEKIAQLINLIQDGKVSHSAAAKDIFPKLIISPDAKPKNLAEKLNLILESDQTQIKNIALQILAAMPDEKARYQAGKKGLLGVFVGKIMQATRGKADPKVATKVLQELLD